MQSFLLYGATAGLSLHGLIHLMGFTSYWKLAEIAELPYKTTLLDGRWDVGKGGIRFIGVFWLLAAIGFVFVTYGLISEKSWWPAVAVVAALLSLVICALDWDKAYMGATINLVILAVLGLHFLGVIPELHS